MATVENKAVMRGSADSGCCGVNLLKTQGRGGAGLVGGVVVAGAAGRAALCAGMTSILHPSTGTDKFPRGAYEFPGVLLRPGGSVGAAGFLGALTRVAFAPVVRKGSPLRSDR